MDVFVKHREGVRRVRHGTCRRHWSCELQECTAATRCGAERRAGCRSSPEVQCLLWLRCKQRPFVARRRCHSGPDQGNLGLRSLDQRGRRHRRHILFWSRCPFRQPPPTPKVPFCRSNTMLGNWMPRAYLSQNFPPHFSVSPRNDCLS